MTLDVGVYLGSRRTNPSPEPLWLILYREYGEREHRAYSEQRETESISQEKTLEKYLRHMQILKFQLEDLDITPCRNNV